MFRETFAALLSLLPLAPAWASPGPFVLSPGDQCRAAIGAAERTHGIPPQLMAAIGRVESGRRDPATGQSGAWPWTINAEGQGAYFDTKAQAIAAVESLRVRGVRSIDVGCMQVNLMHHAAAFASLDQAFEPAVNADYAARFLTRLYGQTGDWIKATANYHSAVPALGDPYARQVMDRWPEEQRKAGVAPPPPPAPPPVVAAGGAPPVFRNLQIARVLPLAAGIVPGPAGIAGHGLDFYRAMPVIVAMRGPPRPMR